MNAKQRTGFCWIEACQNSPFSAVFRYAADALSHETIGIHINADAHAAREI
jgi:hypothetical protein